jgi:Acetyltransferase (GNAT) domain
MIGISTGSDVVAARGRRPVYTFQPLTDPRWGRLLEQHPSSSVFHTAAWLDALHRTYGYVPTAITTCPPGTELRNAAVFCRVESWLTGRRLVALPFSDHCDLLADSTADLALLVSALREEVHRQNLRYVEARPLRPLDPDVFVPDSTYSYCFHQIDLAPGLDVIRSRCHKNSTQRKIRRAQREGLTYQEGRSAVLLEIFYDLYLLTRRRQRVLPQPKRWFQNLMECCGPAVKIRVAFKGRQPVAAILTIRHKQTLVYKYGCSDARFQRLGGVHLLFWRSIEEAKRDDLYVFDLGRSACEQTGLTTFKDRWGARRSVLTYFRLLNPARSGGAFATPGTGWKQKAAGQVLPRLPDRILTAAANVMCRHLG